MSLYVWRAAPGTKAPDQEVVPSRVVPLYDENGYLIVDVLFNQDYMAWMTQGDIAKRELEKLGESDKGIILFRKMLTDQLNLVQDGAEPSVNVFRDPSENTGLEYPVIPHESGEFVGASNRRQGENIALRRPAIAAMRTRSRRRCEPGKGSSLKAIPGCGRLASNADRCQGLGAVASPNPGSCGSISSAGSEEPLPRPRFIGPWAGRVRGERPTRGAK